MATYQKGNSIQIWSALSQDSEIKYVTYKIKCKWQNEAKEVELNLGGEQKLNCM